MTRLLALDEEAGRRALAAAFVECGSKLTPTAHWLGIHRSHLYRLFDQHRMWPVIERLRREARERNPAHMGKSA